MSSPTKQSEEAIDHCEPELDEGEIDGYIISTPMKSTKTVNEACLPTPSSLASPTKTMHDGMETPKKQVGVFGHDARQWTVQGDHTPPRASWRSQKE